MLKVSDFGFAKTFQKTDLFTTVCGSPHYVAPEIIEEKHYDCKVDCWSLGVMLFELFSDQLPFTVASPDQTELFNVIKRGKYEFNENWEGRSQDAKDLVKHLLELDPAKRYSMEQVKEHKWCESF